MFFWPFSDELAGLLIQIHSGAHLLRPFACGLATQVDPRQEPVGLEAYPTLQDLLPFLGAVLLDSEYLEHPCSATSTKNPEGTLPGKFHKITIITVIHICLLQERMI